MPRVPPVTSATRAIDTSLFSFKPTGLLARPHDLQRPWLTNSKARHRKPVLAMLSSWSDARPDPAFANRDGASIDPPRTSRPSNRGAQAARRVLRRHGRLQP